LVAYVGALALLAIVGIHFFDQLPAAEEIGAAAAAGCSVARALVPDVCRPPIRFA